MSKKPRFPPKPKIVVLVVFPGFQILDAAGPIAAFEIATRFAKGAYRLRVVAAHAGSVASSSGISMPAERFGAAATDTLMVVGGNGTQAATADAALIRAIQGASARARRVSSVCSGAFLLASAGLLRGKRATTHWRHAERLARLFPDVRVEADSIYVRDGKVWTAAGVSAGIDLACHDQR
jgi:transcriptional regulator GlxA family with amidase domain